jgi:hypothetical protein
MNVEIGTEVAQFPEKEYINGIFLAVYMTEKRGLGACKHRVKSLREIQVLVNFDSKHKEPLTEKIL